MHCIFQIGTQFQDSENAQRNLDIAQVPKLHGTYTCNLNHVSRLQMGVGMGPCKLFMECGIFETDCIGLHLLLSTVHTRVVIHSYF